jgi:pimeloyl-ACP methyl ester carboxylesterase
MKRISVAGTELLHRAGEGVPLVLLHGIGSDAESWLLLADALPDVPLIAWWAPGYGGSAPLAKESPTPADYADRLAEVLDSMSLPRVVLVGHSLGCLFAGAFAAAHPRRVANLAFVSPALGYRIPADGALPSALQARLTELAALGAEEFAAQRAARLVHRAEAHEHVRRGMARVNLAGYAQAVRALGAGDLLADAARIGRTALVAVGAHDAVTPPHNARALHAALPAGSTLHIVPEAGHALPQEAPAELAALLAREAAHG